MSPSFLSRKGIRKERKMLQPIFVRKTKIEEKRVDEKVDEKIGDMSRGRPAAASTGSPLASPYCRNYNIIDSIVIIDCSSSCPSERALRRPALDGTRTWNGKKIYGFTERIRAILPRHVHTPSRVASLILIICVTFERILNVTLLSPRTAYDSSSQGLLLRRLYLAQWHICSYL